MKILNKYSKKVKRRVQAKSLTTIIKYNFTKEENLKHKIMISFKNKLLLTLNLFSFKITNRIKKMTNYKKMSDKSYKILTDKLENILLS